MNASLALPDEHQSTIGADFDDTKLAIPSTLAQFYCNEKTPATSAFGIIKPRRAPEVMGIFTGLLFSN